MAGPGRKPDGAATEAARQVDDPLSTLRGSAPSKVRSERTVTGDHRRGKADQVSEPAGGVVESAADADLVERSKNGDRKAFERLYHANLNRVFALCLRMTADESAAEELTQQTFIRAWERLGTFRGDSAFSTWLHRIAANLVKESWRSRKRRHDRVRPVADLTAYDVGREDGRPAARIALERAISDLPDGARTALVLYDVEGYKHREIADMLGVTVGTVKSQVHRARRLLRETLEG